MLAQGLGMDKARTPPHPSTPHNIPRHLTVLLCFVMTWVGMVAMQHACEAWHVAERRGPTAPGRGHRMRCVCMHACMRACVRACVGGYWILDCWRVFIFHVFDHLLTQSGLFFLVVCCGNHTDPAVEPPDSRGTAGGVCLIPGLPAGHPRRHLWVRCVRMYVRAYMHVIFACCPSAWQG
jgi:hypothetical protein